MAGKLTFGLDFDDTFTADPALWREFIVTAIGRGHSVVCISARTDDDGNRRELTRALPENVRILLSYATAKQRHAAKHGVQIDIWIDDCPEAIIRNFDGTDEAAISHELAAENKSLWDENARLRIAVDEARRCRDSARNDATLALQAEMAALRAEVARLTRSPTN